MKYLTLYLSLLVAAIAVSNGIEVKKASQCFKSRGIPTVDFNCDKDSMIRIYRAYHGIALRDRLYLESNDMCKPNPKHTSTNCTYCENDCIDDSMNMVYDWSTCQGNYTCLRTVMQSYMPKCTNGKRKFSDYLQVEYECVPRTKVMDICTYRQNWINEGYIISPNYPNNYPIDQDCQCDLTTDWGSKIQLTFYDLLLGTKNGRCQADWLMFKQKDARQRHCGAIMSGTKTVNSTSNTITLQFHSDANDTRTQKFQYFTRNLKGFWIHYKAVPHGNLQVSCRRLHPNEEVVKNIKEEDSQYEEITGEEGMENNEVETTMETPEKSTVATTTVGEEDREEGKKKILIKGKGKKKIAGMKNEVAFETKGSSGSQGNHQLAIVSMTTGILISLILKI